MLGFKIAKVKYMKNSCSITIYVDTLQKIIQILQKYAESLDNFDDIEEIINIIHFLQKEMYKTREEAK